MRAEYQRRTARHISEILDEDGTFFAQIIHDKFVMDDFMTHVNWSAVFFQRPLDDFDGAINTGAKAAWVGEQDFGFTHLASCEKRKLWFTFL